MEQVTVDQVVQENLFKKEASGKFSWKFCNQIKSPRSQVVYFVQIFVILMLIILRIVKMAVVKPTCEETSAWISTLSSLVDISYQTPDYEQKNLYQ